MYTTLGIHISNMRRANKLIFRRSVVHNSTPKPLDNRFLALRMLEIWLLTFRKNSVMDVFKCDVSWSTHHFVKSYVEHVEC